jgi:hypothetical protein
MHETEEDIVEVYSAADIAEAHFLRGMLEEAGIQARVVGDELITSVGSLGAQVAPRVWVHRADAPRAKELLKEYEQVHRRPHPDDDTPAETWKCSTCGESVDADLDLCWNCQTPRKPY